MKRPRTYLIPLVLLLIVGGGLRMCRRTAPSSGEDWHAVAVEHDARVLWEVGTLEARVLCQIQAEIDGTITEVVEDGSPVEPGQMILQVDQEELQNRLESEVERLELTEEEYQAQIEDFAVLTNSFHSTTQLKLAERDHAELELEMGSIPLTEEAGRLMEIDVTLAELDLTEKEAELVRQQELVKRNFAPPSSLDRIRLETAAARTYLEEKRSQFELASQPVPEEDRLTLQAALEKAQKEVARNEEKQALQLRIQKLNLEGLQLEIEHKKEELALLRHDLDRVNLTAPTSGLVRLFRTYVWSAQTWQPHSVGKRIRARDMVATIVDPEQLSLRLMLHESDFPGVSVGQPVRATLTAFPDEVLKGHISSVAEVGQDRDDLSPLYRQSPPIGQALFLAQVELDIENSRALPGMTTHVEIELDAPRERLLIPGSALHTSAPPYEVIRKRDGRVKNVTVEGRFDRLGRFEVLHGLQAGDSVQEWQEDPL